MIKLWQYRRYRFGRLYILLLLVCGLAYGLHRPLDPPNGGTWLGYGFGILATLLALQLLLLGAKRRWWIDKLGSQQAWLSLHLWAGVAMVPLSLLHSGFQWGWSLHGVLLTLLVAVCVSGFYGVYAYTVHPAQLRQLNSGMGTVSLLESLAALDQQLNDTARKLPSPVAIVVRSALTHTALPVRFWQCVRRRDRSQVLLPATGCFHWHANPGQQLFRQWLGRQPAASELLPLVEQRDQLLAQIRQSTLLETLLGHWLRWHLALSLVFAVLLVCHIWVVLRY